MVISAETRGTLSKELQEIFSPLASHSSVQVFVHGSWADNTRTAFSDLDDFIILDTTISEEEMTVIDEKLEKIEWVFQKLDPLQHHGHWKTTKEGLLDYDNSYIPLFILNNALIISGKNELDATVNKKKTQSGVKRNVIQTCRNIELFYSSHKKGILNIYNLKCFVGSFALIPPLVFQMLGMERDKRSSLLDAMQIFSPESMKLIKWATDLRDKWDIITSNEAYVEFCQNLDSFLSAEDWRKFANLNSPILSYEALSSIVLSDDLIQGFIDEVIRHIDNVSLQQKKDLDYISAYQKVEAIAIQENAIVVGQFGNIKWPTISDLDVFICFPDNLFNKGCEVVQQFIYQDDNIDYIFTHPPVFVSESMLPYVKYLHTLYDLNITYLKKEITIDKFIDDEYNMFLNKLWMLFFAKIVSRMVEDVKYIDIRLLTLVLKNTHTSIHNIEKILGIDTQPFAKSERVRHLIMDKGIDARQSVVEEFKCAVSYFILLIDEMSIKCGVKKDYFIYNRSLIFKSSTELQVVNYGGRTIVYAQSFFHNLFYELISDKKNASISKYLTVLNSIDEIITLNRFQQNPFIDPFPFPMFLHKMSVRNKSVISILNSLPIFILRGIMGIENWRKKLKYLLR